MKNKLLLSALAMGLSSSLAYAETVFYAPSHYDCSSQNDKCVCVQNESQYFPQSYIMQNDCKKVGPFSLTFDSINLKGNEPEKPIAIYIALGTGIGIVANYLALPTDSSNWQWDPYGYSCNAGPQNCPMILVESKGDKK